MTREQMVEKVADIMWRGALADQPFKQRAELVLDAILPQVTTVAELEALPDGLNLIGTDEGGRPDVWTVSGDMRRFADVYLRAYGPFVVWQPEVTA